QRVRAVLRQRNTLTDTHRPFTYGSPVGPHHHDLLEGIGHNGLSMGKERPINFELTRLRSRI
ncbi:MAG: hypothetical protein ACPGO8_10020, partial [Ilumatobacteraceae bacterium]